MWLKKIIYFSVMLFSYLCQAAHSVTIPVILKKLFGMRGGIRVYSVGNAYSGLSNLTLIVVLNFITLKGNMYTIMCLTIGSLNLLALLVLLVVFREERVFRLRFNILD
jgi:hypothetical protein